MDTAVTYFNENYNRDINIEEYATSKGMSVSWFIRSFKKFTGSTPMQFIVSLRVNNAQVLLETTNYSINEISKIVGYDNQLYFSRLFHKLKGFSPREYRKPESRKYNPNPVTVSVPLLVGRYLDFKALGAVGSVGMIEVK